MKENTKTVLGWIGLSEGGYIDHPNDNGGPTNRGITQRTYDAWRRKVRRPTQSVKSITKDEAETIIFDEYMRPVRFDDLFAGLDYAVADCSVNSGPSRAAKLLQAALGMRGADVDGIIGVKSLARLPVTKAGRFELLDAYADARLSFLKGLKGKSGWATFGKGWKARLEGRTAGSQAGDIGVRDRALRLLATAATGSAAPIPAPSPVGPGKAQPAAPVDRDVVRDVVAPAAIAIVVAAVAIILLIG